jgi:hypothetical protein
VRPHGRKNPINSTRQVNTWQRARVDARIQRFVIIPFLTLLSLTRPFGPRTRSIPVQHVPGGSQRTKETGMEEPHGDTTARTLTAAAFPSAAHPAADGRVAKGQAGHEGVPDNAQRPLALGSHGLDWASSERNSASSYAANCASACSLLSADAINN